jgi:general secretion pathway protein L
MEMRPHHIKRFAGAAAAGFSAALHWWLAELTAMLPAKIKQTFIEPRETTIITIARGNAIVSRIDAAGTPTEISRTPVDTLEAEPAIASSSRRIAVAALPPEAAYIGRFQIPAAAQARLRDAVSVEVGRRSPFRGTEALFDFRVDGRADDGKTLEIEWATVPAALVGSAQSTTRRLGYFPAAVGLAPPGHNILQYVFAQERTPLSFRLRPSTAAMIFSFLFLLAALAYATSHRLEQAAALDHEAASLKPTADTAQKTQATAGALQKALASLAQRAAEPRPVDILRAVTDALPDDSWVAEFTLNGNQLRLAGSSAIAPSLPERLAAVPLFDHPQFRAPITPQGNAPGGKNLDRFDISLMIPSRHAMGDAN